MHKFTDPSKAVRSEKARRFLRSLSSPNDYRYFSNDGYPRHEELLNDAAACLEVFEDLLSKQNRIRPRKAPGKAEGDMGNHGIKVVAKRWEQEVPVTLRIDATSKDGKRQEILRKVAILPFLPRAADQLGVGWKGDFVEVEAVYWCEGDGLTIWIDDVDGRGKLEHYLEDGWEFDIPVPKALRA